MQRAFITALFFLLLSTAVPNLAAVERIPLENYVPGYAEVFFRVHTEEILNLPAARVVLSAPPLKSYQDSFHFQAADISEVIFAQDYRGRRNALLLRFVNEKRLTEIWESNRNHLKAGTGDYFLISGVHKSLDASPIVRLAPDVVGIYQRPSSNTAFALDRKGMNDRLKNLFVKVEGATLCGGGIPVWSDEIRELLLEFYFESRLTTSETLKLPLTVKFAAKDELSARALQFTISGAVSMFLQIYCGMTPEEAAGKLKLLKFKQKKNLLSLHVKDLLAIFGEETNFDFSEASIEL